MSIDTDKLVGQFREFIPFCAKKLELKDLPKIEWFSNGDSSAAQSTFGSFHKDERRIRIGIANRHPMDIMRTLAHELVHYKQSLEGKIDSRSGETGSPIENEANAKAGIIMRDWGRQHPDMFKQEPITEDDTAPTVIKLRGFARSPDARGYDPVARAKRWIDKITSRMSQNPLNPHQHAMLFKSGGEEALAMFELAPSTIKPGATEIKWFKTHPTGSGIGKRAMEKLQGWAAEDNMILTLYPWNKGDMSQSKLSAFYASLGFKPIDSGNKNMIWEPMRDLDENDAGSIDRIIDDLRNHPDHMDSAIDQIVYIVFRKPETVARHRDMLIQAVEERKTAIMRYLLRLLANPKISQEDALYVISPAVRGLKMLGMPWTELDTIKRSIDAERSKELDEVTKVKLSTDPNDYGAYVSDAGKAEKTVTIPFNKIVSTFEPEEFGKMKLPKSAANVKRIMAGIKRGDKLPPLLVRRYKNGYQVLDGHHRYEAYKRMKVKQVLVRVVDPMNITKLDEAKLTHKDPVERWISVFKTSKHPRFQGKTPEQRERMARAAQYHAVQNKKITREGKLLDKPTPSVESLAEKYGVDAQVVRRQLIKGIEVEKEHTSKPDVASEIALDHISEDLWYYKKLAKIEKVDAERSLPKKKHVAEAPLADYQPIGDFDKPGPFRGADRRLVPHPKNQLKAARFFENAPYDFRLFFSNIPGTGKYSEHGPMAPEKIKGIFKADAAQILQGHEDAITVVFVGNTGDSKVMMTPWIMAHRIGHAIQAGGRNTNVGPWRAAEKHFFDGINRLLEEYYGKTSSEIRQKNDSMRYDLTAEYAALFNAIGTQQSSRKGQIRRPYEFLYEMFAQYIGTGKITLNPLPKLKDYGRKAWGRSSKSLRLHPDAGDEAAYTTETLARDMEIMFNDVLSSMVGKVLVM